MKFSIRYIFLLVTAAAIVSAMVAFDLRDRQQIEQERKRTEVVFLIVEYIRDNQGHWPPNWEALQPYYSGNRTVGGNWDFQQLSEDVAIDFSFDRATLYDIANDPEKSRLFEPIKLPPADDRSDVRPRLDDHMSELILIFYRNIPEEYWDLGQKYER